jgi:uncharacterized membrane protein YgdD (TMEM256/DUF423 family)
MAMQAKTMLRAAGALGALGVAMGAFAAHALKDKLSPADLTVLETAVRYQLVHALALGVCAAVAQLTRRAGLAAWCFLIGTVVFSGSLYALVFTGVRALGAVTPFGGVSLILGWVVLALPSRPGPQT